MRQFAILIHRWVGLCIALFLIVSGLTGAVISWDHEIDEWLNSDLYLVDSRGPFHSPTALAAVIEAQDPHAQVVYMPLHLEAGHSADFLVQPRIDPATNTPFPLSYTNTFIDPVTAQIIGTRDANKASLSLRTLMPFLRNLHESLNVPAMWGSDRWGYRFMGLIALAWLIDSFIAMTLTWPAQRRRSAYATDAGARGWIQRWRPSWRVRWLSGAYKLNFDLHRAAGLWVWGIVLIIAFTSFSLNLYREVFFPAMSLVSQVTPGPFETRPMTPLNEPITPRLNFQQAIDLANERGTQEGWERPPGGVFYARNMGFYSIAFFHPDADHDSGGMAIANMYFDGTDGRYLGEYMPWRGSAADIFVQLQFPLHSGRILGLSGRIMMSLMGLVVAMLSATGIIIWARKRRARRYIRPRDRSDGPERPSKAPTSEDSGSRPLAEWGS